MSAAYLYSHIVVYDLFSATSVKRPESRNAQSDRTSPACSDSGKRQSPNNEEVQDNTVVEDMDLESPMSPSNDANTPSEVCIISLSLLFACWVILQA